MTHMKFTCSVMCLQHIAKPVSNHTQQTNCAPSQVSEVSTEVYTTCTHESVITIQNHEQKYTSRNWM